MVIYRATNKIDGKQYIGQTVRSLSVRIAEHKYAANKRAYNLPSYNALAKYGFDNFVFEELDTATSLDELNKKEEFYIAQLDTSFPNGYNLELGGSNKIPNETTRKKQSESRKKFLSDKNNHPFWGKKLPQHHCDAIGAGHRGKTHSEEHKRKNSDANKGEKNHFFGKTHTEESKKLISLSKANKKNPKLGLNKTKKVLCINTDTIYESVVSASKKIGICSSGIAQCARGELKQTRGYRFKYL